MLMPRENVSIISSKCAFLVIWCVILLRFLSSLGTYFYGMFITIVFQRIPIYIFDSVDLMSVSFFDLMPW